MINEFICSIRERIRDSVKQTALDFEMGLAEVIARIIVIFIEALR